MSHEPLPVLLALAGLPATGKSTLAEALAAACGARVYSKDVERARVFPADHPLAFSRQANQQAMMRVFTLARAAMAAEANRLVVLDGRTFLRPGDLEPVVRLAELAARPLRVVRLYCGDGVARQRLEAPEAADHPAADRDWVLYRRLQVQATLPALEHLSLDTGALEPRECLERCLAWMETGVTRV